MDVGSLPVLDGKAIAGIVTDRDIAVRGVAAGMIPQESLVADVMTAEVRFCRADDTIEQAMAEMGDLQVRRLPVLDAQQRNRRHRFPRRPRHATIGAHRRNSARDLDARSLNSKSPNALQRYLLERLIGPAAQHVLRHPWAFAWQTLKGFKANQGLLLAGAVAYYALLSIVPLLILTVIALSQVIDQRELLATLGRYLEWLVPGQARGDRRRARQLPRQARGRRLAAARRR